MTLALAFVRSVRILAIVLAVRRRDGNVVFSPRAETELHGRDELIVLGRPEEVDTLRAYAAGENR